MYSHADIEAMEAAEAAAKIAYARGYNDAVEACAKVADAHIDRATLLAAYETAVAERIADRELLAQFMFKHSYATGHGDSIADLLAEFTPQHAEWRAAYTAAESQMSALRMQLEKALQMIRGSLNSSAALRAVGGAPINICYAEADAQYANVVATINALGKKG